MNVLASHRELRRARLLALAVTLVGLAACGPAPLPDPVCGDGNVDPSETCDDGGSANGDGCSVLCSVEPSWMCEGEPSRCRMLRCGDGVREATEECDDGMDTAVCDADCTFARCGDGLLNRARSEECDDGNVMSGDGCSQTCVAEPMTCGDGTCQQPAETCDNCMPDCMPLPECNGCPDDDGDGYFAARCGGNDCDDANEDVHPDATEVLCNRLNDDCSATTSDTTDMDGDGFNCLLDCDDTSALASPANPREICGDGVDNDCDPTTTEMSDGDMDGFDCAVDCNDANAAVRPGATELCNNGLNDDCDRAMDGTMLAMPTPDVFDADGDGFFCNSAEECNDADPLINRRAMEIACSRIDEDCNPATMDGPDVDRDGAMCSDDCDDADPRRSRLLREVCGDAIDNDCNAMTADSGDADGDGFDCAIDCDDMDRAVFPDAAGRCGPRFAVTEGFESCPAAWTTSGTATSWECGVPAGMFITGAAAGMRAWSTDLDGAYNNNELSYLQSPAYDLSTATTDPVLSFRHIYETESCCDETWVEMSLDGGMTWRKLGAAGEGTNWYSNTSSQWWNGTSGAAGAWRTARIRMTGAAGRPDVRLRWVFSTDGSSTRDGIGVDEVSIDNGRIDLAVASVAAAVSECASGTTVDVRVTVSNVGAVTIPRFDLDLLVDAGAPTRRPFAIALRAGEIRTLTLTLDVGTPGSHTVSIFASAMADEDSSNDAGNATVMATSASAPMIRAVTAAGYTEGFESDAGGWTTNGTASSWARGTPSGTFITGAGTGTQSWVTNPAGLYNASESSFLVSGCLDLSALSADPVLSFQHIFQTEACCDETWVDVWTAETGWVRLGASGSGMNWYNDAANRWWDGTSGTAGVWRTASHPLTGTAGEVVRVRFGFSSDSSGQRDGVGVDEVVIR